MEQIRKIVEVGCKGIAKDSSMLADLVTREKKEVYLVHDAACPSYSFLLVMSGNKSEKTNYVKLGCYSSLIKDFSHVASRINGIFSVKDHHSGGHEAVYLWSGSPIEATILYCLGLRVWKSIVSDRGDSPNVVSVLRKLKNYDGSLKNESYRIREGMDDLPYGRDVKLMILGRPETHDLEKENPSYIIASKIADVHREMYVRHDAAFDEMHRIAKLFGLNLPASPEGWEKKSDVE